MEMLRLAGRCFSATGCHSLVFIRRLHSHFVSEGFRLAVCFSGGELEPTCPVNHSDQLHMNGSNLMLEACVSDLTACCLSFLNVTL